MFKALADAGFTELWGTAEVNGGGVERLTDVYQRMGRALGNS